MTMRSRLGPIVALAVLLLACRPAVAPAQNATALDLMKQATRLERAGNPPGALVKYRKILEEHAQDRLAPVAAYALGNLLSVVLHDTTTALAEYDRVLTAYPTSDFAAEAARRKAECLQGRKQWAEAQYAYTEALSLAGQGATPQATDWLNTVSLAIGDCAFRLGDRRRVVEAYTKVLDGPIAPQPAATALYRLAETYAALGDSENAAIRYAKIVEEYPFAVDFDSAVGRRALIERYRTIDWAPVLAYARTSQDFRRREYAAVPARCDTVLAETRNPALRACAEFRKIVAVAQTGGDYTAANDSLRALLAALPDPRTMPNAQVQLEQYEMLADAEKHAAESPNDAAAQSGLGGLYLQFGNAARAIAPLEAALRLDPQNAATHLLYGYACSAAGRHEEAAAAFEFYIERNPNDTDVLNQVGYTLLGMGQTERAIGFFERLVALSPDDANAHDSLAEGYLNAGRLADSATQYEKALALDPSFANSQFMLGDVYRRLGNNEKAIAAYQRFLTLSPEGAQANQARSALEQLGAK
jgi:tetratricopeptide (TPR) repeat protein